MRSDHSSAPSHPARGILLRILAVACFACMAAATKLADARGVSLLEILFYRNAFSLPLLLGWAMLGPGLAAIRTKRPMAHVTRSAIGLCSMLLNFQALLMLPLADATVIGFSSPFFATALSALVLREQVGRHRWIAVAVGFVGVMIVMQPGGNHIPLAGAAVAVAAAFGTATVVVTLRQIGATETATATVFWFTVAGIIVMGLGMPWFAQMHDAVTWGLLLLVGLFGGAAQLFNTSSLRLAPVSTLAPFDYSQLVWAVLLGWLLWDSRPSGQTWAGAALIVASGLYILHRQRKRQLPMADDGAR